MNDDAPGPLLASGRDGDIYEYGPGLVLRRTRDGRSIEHEARIMDYVASLGYPVPKVHDVRAGGSEIVMERVDGPLMMDDMARHPQRLRSGARRLADLHDQLHVIEAPPDLRQLGDGDRLLHLDLHPLNVIVSPVRGPVVIDWGNAHRGDPLVDVGMTYVLLTCPRVPAPLALRLAAQPLRIALARAFARRYVGRRFYEQLAQAAELKTLDRNMAPDEVKKIRRLAQRAHRRATG